MIAMNARPVPKLTIVILAAGFSSRLGVPKTLARVHGKSLLRRTLALIAPLTSEKIMVVLPRNSARTQVEAHGFKVSFVINPKRAAGLSSSVRCAIRRARDSTALLLLPVDLVGLRRVELAKLVSRWLGSTRRVAARRVGQSGVTPLILPRWLYTQAVTVSGDVGLREMVNALTGHQRVLLDMPSAAADVDTPQDLRAARRRLRHSSFSP